MPKKILSRRKPGRKALNLERFSTARMRSLVRRLTRELQVMNTRLRTLPPGYLVGANVPDVKRLIAAGTKLGVVVTAFDQEIYKFATAHPKCSSLQTRRGVVVLGAKKGAHI